jgi:hypothetical protein
VHGSFVKTSRDAESRGPARYFARSEMGSPETGPYAWRDLRWMIKKKKFTSASQLRQEGTDTWIPLRRVERMHASRDRSRGRHEAATALATRRPTRGHGALGALIGWIVDLIELRRLRKALQSPLVNLADEECDVCATRIAERGCICSVCECALHPDCEATHLATHGTMEKSAYR